MYAGGNKIEKSSEYTVQQFANASECITWISSKDDLSNYIFEFTNGLEEETLHFPVTVTKTPYMIIADKFTDASHIFEGDESKPSLDISEFLFKGCPSITNLDYAFNKRTIENKNIFDIFKTCYLPNLVSAQYIHSENVNIRHTGYNYGFYTPKLENLDYAFSNNTRTNNYKYLYFDFQHFPSLKSIIGLFKNTLESNKALVQIPIIEVIPYGSYGRYKQGALVDCPNITNISEALYGSVISGENDYSQDGIKYELTNIFDEVSMKNIINCDNFMNVDPSSKYTQLLPNIWDYRPDASHNNAFPEILNSALNYSDVPEDWK